MKKGTGKYPCRHCNETTQHRFKWGYKTHPMESFVRIEKQCLECEISETSWIPAIHWGEILKFVEIEKEEI